MYMLLCLLTEGKMESDVMPMEETLGIMRRT